MRGNKIKIFIIDDHDSVRESYIRWLNVEGFKIVGDDNSLNVSVQNIINTKPDIVLLDIDFPNNNFGGLEFAKSLLTKKEIKIVFLSHYDEPEIILKAFKSGAIGYFNKKDNFKHIVAIIKNAFEGCLSISPSALKKLVNINYSEEENIPHKDFGLTTSELKILGYISEGLTNKEIAGLLSFNEKKIKDIISHLLLKLEAKNRAHAVAIAIKNNLIKA